MDKSMHNQIYSGPNRSPFLSRTRQSSASSIVSARKCLHSTHNKKGSISGRFSVSGRSNQSVAIVARSESNILENYGLPLPVMVNEALFFSEKSLVVSISFSINGWAWAVHGRLLLVWQYKDSKIESPKSGFVRTPQRRGTTVHCRELTLPHCDIGHKASLITVFLTEGQQMASCLAVSPTGDVRYWPSIAHDGSSIDVTGILDGQEFDYMLGIPPQGYVLVTTTCSLLVLSLHVVNGRHVIQHKPIKAPTGFFGGIGKKLASIIIGMNSSQDKENKLVKVTGERLGNTDWIVTLLSDKWIQRWQFSNTANGQFIFEDHEIVRKIRDEFHQKFWNSRENSEIEVTLLDMFIADNNIYVLCGAINQLHTPQMHYSIVIIVQDSDSFLISSFIPLKLSLFYSTGFTEFECLKIRFIVNRGIAYLYSEKTIYPVNLSNASGSEFEAEKIELPSQGDKIMNASVCNHIPMFFTRAHGLACVSSADFDPSDFLNSSYSADVYTPPPFSDSTNQTTIVSPNTTVGNLIMYELDPDEIYNDNRDNSSRLKAAFIYHVKRNTAMCNSILQELIPVDTEASSSPESVNSILDKIVVNIAEELAEDIPAADPRWETSYNDTINQKHALGSSLSLQIIQQLREKNLAFNHFIEFLRTVGIWEKLNAVSINGTLKSTWHLLSDINEKIIAAIALKSAQNIYPKLIDEALQMVLLEWKEQPNGNLVNQDLFYVKLTKFQDIIRQFSTIADQRVERQQPSLICATLCEINATILTVLNEVVRFRENKCDLYAFPINKKDIFEYLPWTAMSGTNGIRDTLLHLIDVILKYGVRSTGEPEIKQKLYQQMVELIDFVLDGRKSYLESVKDNEKYCVLYQQYESQRRDLIFPLVEDEEYELAAKLAEKYLDFQTLVVICDRTENQERLDKYIEKYKDFNFSQFAINWHLTQNRQGDLFERFKSNQAALSQFLGDHPSLAWIQLMFNGDFDRASKILFQLARDEVDYVERKKSILSLAKLASLAAESDLSIQIAEINSELTLISYQEQLPINILDVFGYDTVQQKVLKPEEIINLFIAVENESATEFDFRKTLELLNFVEDPFEIRQKIWCAAILRDSWTDYDMNRPLDRIQSMMFFKLVEVCYLMDGDLDDFLPPIEDFLSSQELGNLIQNKSFQYLLKLGYEHIAVSFQNREELGMEQD